MQPVLQNLGIGIGDFFLGELLVRQALAGVQGAVGKQTHEALAKLGFRTREAPNARARRTSAASL